MNGKADPVVSKVIGLALRYMGLRSMTKDRHKTLAQKFGCPLLSLLAPFHRLCICVCFL